MVPFPFIVGCPRSGAGLVRVMFASHPDVVVAPDSPFVVELLVASRRASNPAAFDPAWFVDAVYAAEDFRRWQLPRSTVEISFRENPPVSYGDAVRRVYQLLARRRGRSRYMDATPGNINHVSALSMLFPDSRIVHVIRDGRDVAASLLELGWADRMEDAARYWRDQVGSARRVLRQLPAGRHHELRYEDLVLSPEQTLREVCDAIELPFNPAMLEYRRTANSVIRASPRPHQHRYLNHPLMRGLRDWQRDLPPRAVDRFDALAGDLLTELGYDLRSETVPWRARAGARSRSVRWRRRIAVPQ